MNMNTTETNSPLTPIQALQRCLEWFTRHQPTAVLPGTKLNAIQELQNVIVAEELRNETPHPENYALTLEKIKACVELEGIAGDALRGMVDLWYKLEIKNGASEAEALQTTLDKFAAKTFEMARNIKTENSQLREVLEIARRYALVEYGESAACRIIASETQKVFPANGKETIHT